MSYWSELGNNLGNIFDKGKEIYNSIAGRSDAAKQIDGETVPKSENKDTGAGLTTAVSAVPATFAGIPTKYVLIGGSLVLALLMYKTLKK